MMSHTVAAHFRADPVNRRELRAYAVDEVLRTNGKILSLIHICNPCQPPLERVAYWNEFHPRLGREERQRQGARCMACGVPFCQSGAVLNGMVSGCPLHNLVPEWNDLVYRRKLGRALERLLKTNDFPEFTGRVCPALCEAACTCGLNGQPVTVKDNELGIIEEAWEQGLMSPRPPETLSLIHI